MTWFPDWMKKAPETKPILAPRRFRVVVSQPLPMLKRPPHCLEIADVWAYDAEQAKRMLFGKWGGTFIGLTYHAEPFTLRYMTVDALMPNVVEV